MPGINAKGPWSWGCPQGISVDATPEPNADCQATWVVSTRNVTTQSPAPMVNPENWYFMK